MYLENEVVVFFGPNTPTAKDKHDEFLKRFERSNIATQKMFDEITACLEEDQREIAAWGREHPWRACWGRIRVRVRQWLSSWL